MNLFIYLGLYTYRCYSPVSCVSGALPCLVCSFLDIFSPLLSTPVPFFPVLYRFWRHTLRYNFIFSVVFPPLFFLFWQNNGGFILF